MATIRYSRQRELIYNIVRTAKNHPTAEMVYSQLKPQYPNLSLGTVYRNLNLLAAEGKVVRMPFPVERYDGELSPHGHFCCEACGGVSDVDLPYDRGLDVAAAGMGHQVDRHAVIFYGRCAACTRAAEE